MLAPVLVFHNAAPVAPGNAMPPVACAGSLHDFAWRTLGLADWLERVEDGRVAGRVTVPAAAVLRAVLMGFVLNLGSVRATEDRLKHSAGFRALCGVREPMSDDGMRDVLACVAHAGLDDVLRHTAKRELLRWRAGRFRECLLARRLAGLNCSFVTTKAVVALDGHESHCSEVVRCPDCHVRTKTVKRGKELVEVEEYYHKLVVAQRIGAHPAIVLDAELIKPGEGELTAGLRLVKRLGRQYGADLVGVIVGDALYDCEPFRTTVREAGFRSVVRHKREDRPPGSELAREVDRRDPQRQRPDGWHHDKVTGKRYRYWVQQEPHHGRRYIEVHRSGPKDKDPVQVGALVTDLADTLPAMVAGIIMETRWNQENTGFHEFAGQLGFDRAYVHKGRPTAAWAVVLLALTAFNVWQSYLYRRLGLDPAKPRRTWGDLRRDIFESLNQLLRRPPPVTSPPRPP